MAASSQPTLFGQAVERILHSWTALQIAVTHGCGGPDSKEKAQWMVGAIETWFSENSNVEDYELEDCLADILDAEFDLILEDGSLEVVAKHICRSYSLIKEGRTAEVTEMLQKLPKPSTEQCRVAAEDEEFDAEDGEMETAGPSTSSSQQHRSTGGAPNVPSGSGDASNIVNGTGESSMDVDEEAEEGWTVVRKGKKR